MDRIYVVTEWEEGETNFVGFFENREEAEAFVNEENGISEYLGLERVLSFDLCRNIGGKRK